jgi:hypothetical protein
MNIEKLSHSKFFGNTHSMIIIIARSKVWQGRSIHSTDRGVLAWKNREYSQRRCKCDQKLRTPVMILRKKREAQRGKGVEPERAEAGN